MGIIEQGPRAADFLLSEANGQRSRENILLKTDKALPAGQLLAIGADGVHEPYDSAGDDPENPVVVVGVLYAGALASENTQPAVAIVRDAEVAGDLLVGLDEPSSASLTQLGVLVR